MTVDEEGKVAITKQEVSIDALNVYWLQVLLERDEIERGIGLIEQWLRNQSVECDDFESARATDTERGAKEVNGIRLSRDIENLKSCQLMLGKTAFCNLLYVACLGHRPLRPRFYQCQISSCCSS